ncbi:MAG TPA: alpha/beta fold hydrolase [Steroidobacteraceae bacterium]|nr:alpha/beta fold hydrolase [Steroidobacteraceae bacterium]
MTADDDSDAAAPQPFRPPVPQPATISGPAGTIEARIEDPVAAGVAHVVVGVVCHPHPLHGGTMQNKVVHTAARAMQEAGAATVRFNFRGVGASEGRYDEGVGEIEDALAVIKWARERFACDTLWLGGFSFGAAVALRAAVQGARPSRLVTIAPPVGRLINEPIARPDTHWLVVQGDRDELVDAGRVREWVRGFSPPPELLELTDAEHFFHGKLLELRAGIVRFLRDAKAGT